MTEPRKFPTRLLRQPSSLLERALLNAGAEVKTSDATRVAVLETLGLEHSQVALVRPRPMPLRRGAFLLAAMVVSAAAVAVPLVRTNNANDSTRPAVVTDTQGVGERVAVVNGMSSKAAAEPPPLPVQQPESLTPPSEESTTSRGLAQTGGRNVLAAELAALDRARSKLGSGDPKAALSLLDAYQREFARPRLALEAEVLRIDALERSGQSELARRRAATFVQHHPKGVLTGRVRRYLEK